MVSDENLFGNKMKITDKTVVQFHYTLKDEAGVEIENSHATDPLAYLHG